MRIVVCIKQVPGSTQVEVDPVTGVLRRDSASAKLNPYDLYAIESALTLGQQTGGQVTALTMGPPQARQAVLEAVYMGAQDGVLVTDRRFAGADVLATSYTLAQAIRHVGNADLVLCGKQTTDGDTAQVGAEMAEFLGLPHTANVQAILELTETTVTVRTDREHHLAVEQLPLPCLLCLDGGINTPRLPSYRRKCQTGQDVVTTLTLDDLPDKDANHYGLSGSPTQVERIFPPEKNDAKEMFHGNPQELARQLANTLHQQKFI